MKRISCRIARTDRKDCAVSAYLATPELAVHRYVGRSGETEKGLGWQITHLPTGWSAVPASVHLDTRKSAARLARCLAEEFIWEDLRDPIQDEPKRRDGKPFGGYRDFSAILQRWKGGHDPKVP